MQIKEIWKPATTDKEQCDGFWLAGRLQLNLARRYETPNGRFWSDVLDSDSAFYLHHHQNTNRGKMFYENGVHQFLKLLEVLKHVLICLSSQNQSKIATLGLFAIWCGLGWFAQN